MIYKRKVSLKNKIAQKIDGRVVLIFAFGALLFLSFNKEGRTLIKDYFDKNRLLKNIEIAQKEKIFLENKLYQLQNDSSYFERAVRRELGVIADGEIEYKISVKK